ncbi:hypothetical protein Dacet_1661 [Denitrovibrio acetiphilus DSM 12809]|uniref:Uncharacterized protein n=1 Tax=Denitrovibrio acetiphilus (strain DSM 12809 / NBRC 114555 / N2460) TaxID=522772 RepID=D4H8S7_DENA2|nr:hypothetical protein [Denitrovibrio acetiphilus]ADD68426.1 hypothetical protein Dacet_1661 [Denitrovibrio acetiphilus DSM 12809]
MIDAILTGMTGRITTLNKVEPVRPAKLETAQEKAPKSVDSVSLSAEAVELYNSENVSKITESENYTENETNPAELTKREQQEISVRKQKDTGNTIQYGIKTYMQSAAPAIGSAVNFVS